MSPAPRKGSSPTLRHSLFRSRSDDASGDNVSNPKSPSPPAINRSKSLCLPDGESPVLVEASCPVLHRPSPVRPQGRCSSLTPAYIILELPQNLVRLPIPPEYRRSNSASSSEESNCNELAAQAHERLELEQEELQKKIDEVQGAIEDYLNEH